MATQEGTGADRRVGENLLKVIPWLWVTGASSELWWLMAMSLPIIPLGGLAGLAVAREAPSAAALPTLLRIARRNGPQASLGRSGGISRRGPDLEGRGVTQGPRASAHPGRTSGSAVRSLGGTRPGVRSRSHAPVSSASEGWPSEPFRCGSGPSLHRHDRSGSQNRSGRAGGLRCPAPSFRSRT